MARCGCTGCRSRRHARGHRPDAQPFARRRLQLEAAGADQRPTASRPNTGSSRLWPQSRDSIGVAWLDGRNREGAHEDHGEHDQPDTHRGMTALRAPCYDIAAARRRNEVDALRLRLLPDRRRHDRARAVAGLSRPHRRRNPRHLHHPSRGRALDDAQARACGRLEDAGMPGQWPGDRRRGQRRRGRLVHRCRRQAGGRARAQPRCRRQFRRAGHVDQGAAVQGRVDVALDASATAARPSTTSPWSTTTGAAKLSPASTLRASYLRLLVGRGVPADDGLVFARRDGRSVDRASRHLPVVDMHGPSRAPVRAIETVAAMSRMSVAVRSR